MSKKLSYNDYGWEDGPTDAHSFILPKLLKILENDRDKTILDIGCGNGFITNKLIAAGYNVYGIDASESGINIAREKNPERFFLQNIENENLPNQLENKTFDLIIATEVIEHLYNPGMFVNFCKKILLKNGKGSGELILSTPYHGYIKNLALSLTNHWDHHFTVLWDGGHIKFFSRKTLTKLLEKYELKVIDFKGCGRLPYLWKTMFLRAKIG